MSYRSPLLALMLCLGGCAFAPPSDAEPHAKLKLMVTAAEGNFVQAEVFIDGRPVDAELLATGTFNVTPGPHSLRVEITSGQRHVGKVHRTYGLNNPKTRKVTLSELSRCRGGVMFEVTRDRIYEFHLGNTPPSKRCLIECRQKSGQAGPADQVLCGMTRRY